MLLGQVRLGARSPDEAEAMFQRALSVYQRLDDPAGSAEAMDHLALACLARQQGERAEKLLIVSLQGHRRTGRKDKAATACCNLGHALLMQGRDDEAEQAYRTGLETASPSELPAEAARLHEGLAALCEHRGDAASADEHRRRARQLAP
jgi:tetratricopeptide (TPR) repeat protein